MRDVGRCENFCPPPMSQRSIGDVIVDIGRHINVASGVDLFTARCRGDTWAGDRVPNRRAVVYFTSTRWRLMPRWRLLVVLVSSTKRTGQNFIFEVRLIVSVPLSVGHWVFFIFGSNCIRGLSNFCVSDIANFSADELNLKRHCLSFFDCSSPVS
jgi:hypothetical protein